jgi:copper chaperone CopZ
VRSALLSVKGVTRARVTLENHEAIVTFDPKQASTDDMIAAVRKAKGPEGKPQYDAKVKEKENPVSVV